MRLRFLFVGFLIVLLGTVPLWAAKKSTSSQLAKQRAELKNLEANLAKQRKKVRLLESEEKGVLNTIAVLDENLNRTKE